MEKLTRYLEVPEDKIRSKGIESIRSRVVNLCEYNPGLDIPSMIQGLIKSFERVYGQTQDIRYGEEGIDQDSLNRLNEKYKSWEWRFGESPKFDIELNTRFPWGGIQLGLELEQARIAKAHVYSDAMDEALIEMIPKILQGCLFNSEHIADSLTQVKIGAKREEMLQDMASWIRDKGF
jgi:lipoate-protein ligase A